MNAGNVGANTRLSPTKIQSTEEEKTPTAQDKALPKPKEFLYQDPGVKIGQGKFGPVNLIIHREKLFALKIIPKDTIDKTKRIEHVKNEK